MPLTVKKAALIIAVSTALSACDALQITGGPLELGAALEGSLLDHGGFERGFGDWRACSDPQLVSLKSNDTDTESSAVFDAGGCLFQAVRASENDNMLVNCSASNASNGLANVTLGYLDINFQPLESVEAEITESTLSNVSTALIAPVDTVYAEVLIYAEDGAEVDFCVLNNIQQVTESDL